MIALLAFSPEGIARFEQDSLKRENLCRGKKRFGLKESFHARVDLPFARKLHESGESLGMQMIDPIQISLLDDQTRALNQAAIVVNKMQPFHSELRET